MMKFTVTMCVYVFTLLQMCLDIDENSYFKNIFFTVAYAISSSTIYWFNIASTFDDDDDDDVDDVIG